MKARNLKKIAVLFSMLLISGLILFSTPARAGKDTSFTADHITSLSQSQQMKSKIYYSSGKMCMEMNQPGLGEMVYIYNKKEKMLIMISQAKEAYLEMPFDEKDWPGLDPANDLERKRLGTEKVSGYKCTKYKVVRKISGMGQEQTVKMTSWESDKFSMPLRTKTDKGTLQELRNIKEGEPPAKMFKAPAGYKKAKNMMELMAP